MKYLVAPDMPNGNDGVDFVWTQPGELLGLGHICSKPDCGCDKSFVGQTTRKGTTVAEVVDFGDMDADRIADSFCLSHEMAWENPADRIAMQMTADWIVKEASKFDVGDIVRLDGIGLALAEPRP